MIGDFNGNYITQPGIDPEVPGGITADVNGLLAESYAVSTRTNYTSKMNNIRFVAQYRLFETAWNGAAPTLPPITPTLLMLFATYLIREGFNSAGSITGYSAVKQWCLTHDRPDPTLNPRTGVLDIR